MSNPAFTLTQDSITVIWKGKPHTVQKGAPNFLALRDVIVREDWEKLEENLTVAQAVKSWAKGKFSLSDDGRTVLYDGEEVPSDFGGRILAMAANGDSPDILMSFWERLQRNPSFRSVKQLWGFLQHQGIPLTDDGCFLAYKGVRNDYKDAHSGKFDNSPGAVNEMPRNQISDDPNHACHEGFHVGALGYARTFSHRMVICKVDPEHVVCVPYDSSQQKMRVCKYEVVGNYGSELPSTTFKEDEYPSVPDSPYESEFDGDDDDTPEEPETDDAPEDTDEEQNEDPDEPEEDDDEPTSPGKRKSKKGFAKFDKMDLAKLLEQPIGELRRYATHGLEIVGASKIPGGKMALAHAILRVRS